ncbi:heme biosynthesis HemY N-terminal domain-containing protein [Shewanella gaetbuli]|uniref:Heme biosynthesis protein HemY n=1 Tax=Shewanella gaetbuli TaxID=220752 RepID=A0A9X1ZEW3_9GAMM|nr:heme biosynthesis HemY N-terminal domain-containing protein [Shewanella gaetbuli]MCL1141084.1 heme biosynthesis protein HemY [Shewanella gaetbuli]
MIKMLAYLLIILFGLYIAPYLIEADGYIYIAVWDYQIETSLLFGLFAIIAAFISFELAKKIIISTLHVVLNSRYLPTKWRISKAKKQTLIGALALAEEDWPAAEKAMLKGAENGELPTVNYFAAARAAQHQNKIIERDKYLEQAEREPLAKTAVLTTKTRYLLQQGELTQARTLLDTLEPTSKSSTPVLKLAADLYVAQQDWSALKLIMPILSKRSILTDEKLAQLTKNCNINLLNEAANESLEKVEKCWAWFTKTEKQNPPTFIAYLKALCLHQRQAEALKLLTKQLKANPTELLFSATPDIVTAHDQDIRKLLGKFEQTHEHDESYQVCMAKLALQSREFRQAKSHWQNACRLHPRKSNWLALARVQEQLGDNTMALQSYRHAATIESSEDA